MMRRNLFRLFGAFFVFAAMSVAAKAQESDRLVVNVPYDFVVAGKTLPAGSYTVERANSTDERLLTISSFANRASAVTLSIDVEDAKTFHPSVSFVKSGEQRYLSKIETAEHIFVLPVTATAAHETMTAARSAY